MSEENNKLRPVMRDYICDKCDDGFMRPTEISYLSNPPQYPHICTECGHQQTFGVIYPYVDYI